MVPRCPTRGEDSVHTGRRASPVPAPAPGWAGPLHVSVPFPFSIHLSTCNSGKMISTAVLKLRFAELFSADHEDAELTHTAPLMERQFEL